MGKLLIEKILSNTATSADREKFESWLNESPENQNYFSQCKMIWNELDGVYSNTDFDLKLAKAKIEAKIVKQSKRRDKVKQLPHWALVAASIMLLFGITLFLRFNSNPKTTNVLASATNIEKVELKDGSQVWLNKNSTLKIPLNFSKKERTVYLKGEAYFEIKRNEKMPFKVITGKTVTKVLGTSFNIELDTLTGNVSLNVNSGKVSFYRKHWLGNEYYLTAGVFAQYVEEENRVLIGKNGSSNYLAWKTGKLSFYDTPIHQVCTDLSKFYGVKIISKLDHEAILTGTFDHEPLENVLSVVKVSLGVDIEEENGAFVIGQ